MSALNQSKPPRPKKPPATEIITPFTIVIDTREQAPWSFDGIDADADQKNLPFVVRTKSSTLQTGDYSLEGFESKICIERKSHADLYGTIINGRDRFKRELERMQSFEFSAVIVEASWGRLRTAPEHMQGVAPKSIVRSIMSLMIDYPPQWILCPDRRFAEVYAFQLLRMFWRKKEAARKTAEKAVKQAATQETDPFGHL